MHTTNQKYVERFNGVEQPTRLATRVPAAQPSERSCRRVVFDLAVADAAIALARGDDEALTALLTWTVAVYLAKVSHGDAVVFAVPAPRRAGSWLAMRADIDLAAPAKESLVRVRDELAAFCEVEVPTLEELSRLLGLAESASDNGLCDTAVEFVTSDPVSQLPVSQLSVSQWPAGIALGLRFIRRGAELQLECHWRRDCFEAADIELIPGHLQTILGAFSRDLSRPLAGASVLTDAEMARLLDQVARTPVESSGPVNVAAAFWAIVEQHPTRTALVFEGTEFTYAEVGRRAERVAAALIHRGVTQGHKVALMAQRDEWLLPSMLGVLRAGCAYVPVDPTYPAVRVSWVLDDCGASALLVSDGVVAPSGQLVVLKPSALSDEPIAAFPNVGKDDVAYMIYTSGSTGVPKGVPITHGNVLNFFLGMDGVIPHSEGATWLAITSISFDISVLELLWTSCRGVRVVLQPSGRLVEADEQTSRGRGPAFSLFLFSDVESEHARQRYELMFKAAQYADDHDMEAIWFPERHFHRFGGIFPNPSLTASALAARTRRVHLRAGSVVSPLHHPLRVAEEWSFVDNISNGRVGVSFASGWNQRDFVLAGSPFSRRRERVVEDLQLTRRFWRGDTVSAEADGTSYELELFPRPIQAELPTWLTASSSVDAFKRAGELGVHLLTHMLHHSPDALREKIEAYREAWAAHHGTERRGQVTLMVHTFLADSLDYVRSTIREPFKRYLSSSAELMQAALPDTAVSGLSESDRAALIDAAFDRFVDERGLFGTPESCVAKVRRLQDLGVDEVACLIDFIPDDELVHAHLPYITTLQRLVNREAAQLDVAGQIEAHRVTHFQCTPSLAKALMDSARFRTSARWLEVFAVGGEAFPRGLQCAVHQVSGAKVLNMYGPTETTVWSTVQEMADDHTVAPLGQPIANTSLYVLAQDRSPLPVNRVGELCIGGRGVAPGYWNRPQLSLERFVANPFGPTPSRLYRTGDLVRIDHEGVIHFLGRRDRQVKLRGHRIELGEIESRLRSQPGVRDVVVATVAYGETRQLCAFYTAAEPLDEIGLHSALRTVLPDYMVPDRLSWVSEFPLTPNRKIDVNLLVARHQQTGREASPAQPIDPTQIGLLAIWSRVLGRAELGVDDDFFKMGGDSVQAIQAAALANAAGFPMSPRMLYEYPTVARLARVVQSSLGETVAAELPVGEFGLLSAQQWFFSMSVPNRNHWNQSLQLTLTDTVDADALRRALASAVDRHPAFRLRFREKPAGWVQAYEASGTRHLGFDSVIAPGGQLDAVVLAETERAQRGLDLARGPLMRAAHVVEPGRGAVLVLVAHHLIIDGVSWRILLDDVARGLGSPSAGLLPPLPRAPGPHDALQARAARRASPEWARAQSFWSTAFQTRPVALWAHAPWREDECETQLGQVKLESRDLATIARRLHADPEIVALATLVRGLRSIGLGNAFAVDMESHGRGAGQHAEFAVGWLTQIYPVFVPPGTTALPGVLGQVKAARREVEAFKADYEPSAVIGAVRPSIIFNYLGRLDASLLAPGAFTGVSLSPGTPRDPAALRHHALEVNVHQTGEGLVWEFIYPTAVLDSRRSAELVEACVRCYDDWQRLTEAEWRDVVEASDFPDVALSNEEIRTLACHAGGLEDVTRATTQQRAIYFQLQACPSDRTRFVHQALIDVRNCDPDRLTRALRSVVAHHGAFRSAFFVSQSGELMQAVYGEAPLRLRGVDFRALDEPQRQDRLTTLRNLDFEQGIDPEVAPLTRAYLVRWDQNSCRLLWTYHHLIADGWSLPLMLRDLLDAYECDSRPTREPGHFGDFARWLAATTQAKHQAFWLDYLRGCKPATTISPLGSKRDFSYRVEYGVLSEQSDAASLNRWEGLARSLGATFAAVLHTALGIVLCRLTQRPSTVFGTTVAGRPAELPLVDETVGLFINSVPMRFEPRVGESYSDLIRRTHAEGSSLREHSYVEPVFLNGLLGLSPGQMPFETVLVVQNFSRRDIVTSDAGPQLSVIDFVEHNPAPLTIEAVSSDNLTLRAVYDCAHFGSALVAEVLRQLRGVMDEFVRTPDHTERSHGNDQGPLEQGDLPKCAE